MSWIALALLSTLIFSLCVIFDKFFGSHKIKSVYSFATILAVVSFPFVAITTYFMRTTFTFSIGALYSVIAGLFWFIMWLFYWKALQKGEASRVSAVYFTVPIYSALIGMFFLHEVLLLLNG